MAGTGRERNGRFIVSNDDNQTPLCHFRFLSKGLSLNLDRRKPRLVGGGVFLDGDKSNWAAALHEVSLTGPMPPYPGTQRHR